VVVDIPKDVSLKTSAFDYPDKVEMRSYNPVRKGHGGPDPQGVQLLLAAKRPIHLHRRRRHPGQRFGRAAPSWSTCWATPVTNTLMGLGGYPGHRPQFLGMLGMHGTYEANMPCRTATCCWPSAPASTTA
jgi:acetolactate synthase-1/2/3 large subunit